MTSSVDAAGYERAALTAGDVAESARYAFWLGLSLMMRGQAAPASGGSPARRS
jgi:hypothetical protein